MVSPASNDCNWNNASLIQTLQTRHMAWVRLSTGHQKSERQRNKKNIMRNKQELGNYIHSLDETGTSRQLCHIEDGRQRFYREEQGQWGGPTVVIANMASAVLNHSYIKSKDDRCCQSATGSRGQIKIHTLTFSLAASLQRAYHQGYQWGLMGL